MAIDDSLVIATQAGDRSAFEQIYEAYYDRIFRYALVRLGNRAEAEDVASDVFLKALEAIPSYTSRGLPFSAWLFRIAHNLVIDRVRSRKRHPTAELDDRFPVTQGNPEEQVVAGITYAEVMAVMGEITDAQRQVLALRFGAGLSISETAQALKKNENAVKAMQHSAIGALRRNLSRRGHEIPG